MLYTYAFMLACTPNHWSTKPTSTWGTTPFTNIHTSPVLQKGFSHTDSIVGKLSGIFTRNILHCRACLRTFKSCALSLLELLSFIILFRSRFWDDFNWNLCTFLLLLIKFLHTFLWRKTYYRFAERFKCQKLTRNWSKFKYWRKIIILK